MRIVDVDAVGFSPDLRDAGGVCSDAEWIEHAVQVRSPPISVPVISSTNWRGRDRVVLDYRELLRRMAVNDARVAEDCLGADSLDPPGLDAKTLELVRLAALVAVGGAVPSYGAQADAAVNAGATATEIVDVLVGVVPIVGLPCAVAAAPKLALALGYDTDDE